MKIASFLFSLVLFTHLAQAQVPQGIPYQAAARNASGQALVNTAVKVRFSILDSVATGTLVYKETHSTTTNSVGLFNVNVGMGTPVTGTFSSINWGKNAKFMQMELDITGTGSNYVNMGTQQMLSVPYALYAGSAKASLKAGTGISISGDTINAINMNSIANASNLTGKTNIGFSSSGTWTCPTGITQIMVQLWGGAGGAGANGGFYAPCGTCGQNGSCSWQLGCGGFGGEGGYNRALINVNPGTVYTIQIGSGGSGGTWNFNPVACGYTGNLSKTAATDGQNSVFKLNGTSLLIATGGTAGAMNMQTLSSTPPLTNAAKGANGTIVNFQSTAISYSTAAQTASNVSYIPTGYVQTQLVPSSAARGGVPDGWFGNWNNCYSNTGSFNYGQSGGGEPGFCIISY